MKNNTTSSLGFFNYFRRIIGWHIYGYILLNFLVGILDGLGLAMFIPLLSIATGDATNNESLGQLEFLVIAIKRLGIELNLATALGLMISLFVFKGIFFYIRTIYFTKIRLVAMRKIRWNLLLGFKDLSYEGFTKLDAGRIQNNMIGEVDRLVNAMVTYFVSIQHVVMLLTYVVLAFLSNWQFAIMVDIGGGLTNIFYKYINKKTKEYSRKQSFIGHDFNGNLIQAINNFKYLKATNYFKTYERKLKNNIWVSEDISFKMGKIGAIAESLREPMIIIIIAMVILVQVNVMGGSFGSILVSLLLFYRALAHLVSMQNSWNNFMRTSAGLESVEFILSEFKRYQEPELQGEIQNISTIDTKNVSVTYGRTPVLKNINLSISPKSSIALVGESGAGKTTLANVLCGLLPPHEGEVFVDDISLYKRNLSSFRDKVGYITQEPVIFDDSIFNNVTFWAEKTPENIERFWRTMEMVSMKTFVEGVENKEDARLGNNGILVSGGQKQRISIARELYKEVELLVMDEATSALDSETEKHIKESIDMLQGKFTMIIIAHRLSTVKNVDQVYLMEKGEIINHGTFSELLNKSERFKKMVELQEV
ncbi:ABC transporter ATP-binding protein/permease [Riemerella anatipestifer]|uniref:ABC transporter ATP-binding protein n=1 Tax=Riemerella anatipestifer TaxID=34085 RepID=UPI00129D82E3|nr:ABC transporter ATP-binding protein [Riemerella anatipestifer]MRM84611.1 ABC transporter ATP-binding protein [Riemerella anatipestifer]MRN16770.1 ABC transporter ATP-binding protein [Riemerella anatipestifer]WPC10265.1 ABC transporter ATP-binding protein/permease [Riemerella anatipestifer]WPC14092.1 ABC transporter ATP-binding protein/permease [Riemerella anatipestifer]WPC16237.1 ABC transporter ATP-binding protein/permease [Riemerella anatipestifer]